MSGIDILINVICVAVVIVSLLLICLVLVQPSKSGGMGAAFGGIGQSVFGAQMGSHLTKLTVILTSVFFVLALGLAFLIGHRADVNERQREVEVLSDISASSQPIQAAPAADGALVQTNTEDTEKVPEKQ